MNFLVSPAHLATALACVMIPLPASAESPARLGPEERALIEADSASVGDGLKTASAGVKEQIEADRARSNGANDTVRDFLAQAALVGISIEDAPASVAKDPGSSTEPVAAPNKPLEVKPGPNDTLISADDGMYFDAEKGLLVYLKNVRLTGPDFDLSGANELKVFLGKKEEKKKAPAKEGEPAPVPEKDEKKDEKKEDKKAATPGILGAAGGFGDPEKIVATGAVKITQKAVGGKPPVVASAAVLTYDAKTGEIILNGGYPWVQQGATFMRAKEANLYLRIKKDGSFVTEGLWDMGGQLNANPAPPKPAPKPANP
jgi:lipopolysaccharide export system protein LptA